MPERSAAGILWLMLRDAPTQTCLSFNWRIFYSSALPRQLISDILTMKPVE